MKKSMVVLFGVMGLALGVSLAVAEPSYDLDPMMSVEDSGDAAITEGKTLVSNVVKTEDAIQAAADGKKADQEITAAKKQKDKVKSGKKASKKNSKKANSKKGKTKKN